MREHAGLIGYGMATAVCGVPAVERLHAAYPPRPGRGHVC
jgi:hypothetical protein